VVGNTCSNYVIVLDIGDAAGQLLYRRTGASAGCIADDNQTFVAMTFAPMATSTTVTDADLTIMANAVPSKITPGRAYTVRAHFAWRSQEGTYRYSEGPPEYEASSDLFTLTLR